MKRMLCFLMSLIFMLLCFAFPAYASGSTVLNISADHIDHKVSENLYGISLEDISYAGDGGLVSNLVNNNSFEYSEKPEYAWEFSNISAVLSTSDPMNVNNPSYETLTVDGKGTVKNLGFAELYDYKSYDYDEDKAYTADMGFKEGISYDFSCYVKNIDFEGTISVYLDSKSNSSNIIQLSVSAVSSKEWTELSTTLTSAASEDGCLAVIFEGTGSISIDFVSLIPQDAHGYGTEEWKYVTLRNDLYEALENLNPSFIRFPGGCVAEGDTLEELYSWKNTIGDITERPQTYNVHRNDENGNHYNNTNSMGYHEYFQLCEDLGAEPVPVVNAGLTCQSLNGYDAYSDALKKVSMTDDAWTAYLINDLGYDEKDEESIQSYTDYVESLGINSSDDFESYLDTIAYRPGTDEFNNYAQDILDLIEYANGDSQTTYWGALRSANGHAEPFNIKYIALGSENRGEVYFRNFDELKKIINENYPDITVISSSGSLSDGDALDYSREQADEKYPDTIVDEHYFTTADYLFSHNDRYDSYDRDSAAAAVSGYSADSQSIGAMITKSNIWSAAAEASFMTGFERNSDLLKMTSYSPVFAKLNANSNDINLIWFDSQDIVLTPNYYNQMLFSNNIGTSYIDAALSSDSSTENIYQSVTVDEEKQVIYIKFVNSGSSQKLTVNLDGFEDINYVSNQSISDGYKSASNELGKQRVAPVDDEITASAASFEITAKANSINVIRIAYGENTGDSLYQLPDTIDYSTQNYIPPVIKAVFACICLAIPVGSVIGFMLYRKVISKNKKKGRADD